MESEDVRDHGEGVRGKCLHNFMESKFSVIKLKIYLLQSSSV